MPPHPESARLTKTIERCLQNAIKWSGVVYRSASVRYANKDDLLTGAGSKTTGARWNPRNSFRTIYTSLDLHTAIEEALAHYHFYRLPLASATPRVLVGIRVRLQRILDLTRGATRSALKVSLRRLLDEPWREVQQRGEEALTQAIGRIAYERDWEGLLVPSAARDKGVNLVLFPGNFLPRSWLEIINRSDLP